MIDYDILIAGGQVLDGTGAPPFRADLAIKDGRIAAMFPHGAPNAGGSAEIDAHTLLLRQGHQHPVLVVR